MFAWPIYIRTMTLHWKTSAGDFKDHVLKHRCTRQEEVCTSLILFFLFLTSFPCIVIPPTRGERGGDTRRAELRQKGFNNLKHQCFGKVLLKCKWLNMSCMFCLLLCFSLLLYFITSARWLYGGNAFWSAGEFFVAILQVATGQLLKESCAVLSYPRLNVTFMIWRENWVDKSIMWSPTLYGFLCSLSPTACLGAPLSATWVTW